VPGASRYLLPGETLLVSTRRHPAALMKPAAVWLMGLLAASAVSILLAGWTPPPLAQVSSGVIAFAFTLQAAVRWAGWFMDRYVITDERVLRQEGMISLRVSAVKLSPETDITFSRTPWGRLLNYGSLTLHPSGERGPTEKLTFVPRPIEHYRLIASLTADKGAPRGGNERRTWMDPQEEDTGPLPPVVA
jgi:hypothetical protein